MKGHGKKLNSFFLAYWAVMTNLKIDFTVRIEYDSFLTQTSKIDRSIEFHLKIYFF